MIVPFVYVVYNFLSIDDCEAFVYLITNTTNNRKYIGKKLAKRKVTRPPLKGKKNKRRSTKESDWRTYWGSSEHLKNDVNELGEDKFMGTNQDCPATAAKAVAGAINTMTDKNPYNTSANAVQSSGSFVAGQVSVSASGSTLTVKTCTKTGCASADQLTATVSVD